MLHSNRGKVTDGLFRSIAAYNLQQEDNQPINSEAMKENEKTTCEPCERNFERNIHNLVKEGEAPTSKEREKKQKEVKEAFARKETVK